MKLINQSCSWVKRPEQWIERSARTCYQSFEKQGQGTDEKMIKMLLNKKHEAMLEFSVAAMSFITDVGVTHELVRSRIGISFAQESTRWVNYKDKDIEFILPVWWDDLTTSQKSNFKYQCEFAEKAYKQWIKEGFSPQQARQVLPKSLKTEIIVSGNYRTWLNLFRLRIPKVAHPQMRELMLQAKRMFQEECSVVFGENNICNKCGADLIIVTHLDKNFKKELRCPKCDRDDIEDSVEIKL